MNSTTTLGTDVCRIRESSSFFCPLGCMHTDEAPYCAQGDSTMSRVPCRAQPPLSSTDTAGRAAKAGEKGDWTNVSVKGVPMSVSSSFMRELFSTTGEVRSVNVHRKSSGAFYSANVAYSSRAAALEAAKRFNGESILDSPPLVVRKSWAHWWRRWCRTRAIATHREGDAPLSAQGGLRHLTQRDAEI